MQAQIHALRRPRRAVAAHLEGSALRREAWPAALAVGGLAIALYYLAPSPGGSLAWLPHVVFYDVTSLLPVAAIGVAIWLHRPRRVLPWVLLWIAQATYLVADVTFYTYHDVFGILDYPAPSDAIYLARYPVQIAGLVLILRSRRRGASRSDVLDGLIVASGAAVITWFTLIEPSVTGPGIPMITRLTSAGYPVMDLFLITLVLFLAVGGGRRSVSFLLLTAALGMVFATDTVYGVMQMYGVYATGDFVDAGWLVSYVLLAAAALHPSMRMLTEPTEPRPPAVSRWRIASLTFAAMITPVVLAWVGISQHDGQDFECAGWAVVVFALVVVRMVRLMRDQQAALAEKQATHARLGQAYASLQRGQQERARLLRGTVDAVELERVRIATELHDGPIQHLAAVAYLLDRASRRLARGDTATAGEQLSAARQRITGEILDLRRLMVEMRPPVLDERGIVAAISDYGEAFQRERGVHFTLTARTPIGELPTNVETVLYRVVQEALANVTKHARGTRVDIAIEDADDRIDLHVVDDGVGFDTSRLSDLVRDGHFGLVGMRERVESMGGTWQVLSAPGRGTAIEARCPRTRPASDPATATALDDDDIFLSA